MTKCFQHMIRIKWGHASLSGLCDVALMWGMINTTYSNFGSFLSNAGLNNCNILLVVCTVDGTMCDLSELLEYHTPISGIPSTTANGLLLIAYCKMDDPLQLNWSKNYMLADIVAFLEAKHNIFFCYRYILVYTTKFIVIDQSINILTFEHETRSETGQWRFICIQAINSLGIVGLKLILAQLKTPYHETRRIKIMGVVPNRFKCLKEGAIHWVGLGCIKVAMLALRWVRYSIDLVYSTCIILQSSSYWAATEETWLEKTSWQNHNSSATGN